MLTMPYLMSLFQCLSIKLNFLLPGSWAGSAVVSVSVSGDARTHEERRAGLAAVQSTACSLNFLYSGKKERSIRNESFITLAELTSIAFSRDSLTPSESSTQTTS